MKCETFVVLMLWCLEPAEGATSEKTWFHSASSANNGSTFFGKVFCRFLEKKYNNFRFVKFLS